MIGIFDSGIGGLTVVKSLMEELPGYNMIYFGDTARTPYGSKSPETVVRYALENTDFLLKQGAKLIVMACNTASSVAADRVAENYDIPIFEVVTPATEQAVKISNTLTIGVIGTRATVKSGIYEHKIMALKPDAKVYSAACPLLVPLVEEGWMKKPETVMIIKKYLHPLKVRQIDTLILGCTHYPLLKDKIQRKIGKRVHIIDSSIAIAENVKFFLDTHPEVDKQLSKNNAFRLFVSDITEQFEKTARATLKRNVHLEHVEL
ncbi:MAG: glutamate racemase [Deltaproteobacteria bacterium]|nr:glutamate racemase [Deltaproteobacteria bacterium]MBW1826335.1 glutamate racemase [Deltaproteobacteria bacterium]MBW1970127.1 glutamate racemase [Deltaproteobacteria bacterium]MBW2155994.1 glutamate racemase [Deltaproteobacteria bacterium]MBW2196734.1 glutamate racemase [Deltaproteobacteria bacterium]